MSQVNNNNNNNNFNVHSNNKLGYWRFYKKQKLCCVFCFLLLLFTAVLSQWGFSHGKFGLPSLGKASCDRVALPKQRCSDMHCGIFNVRTDVKACDCARGCTDTVRESALQVDSGRKISCRTGKLNLRRRRTGPMFYQLSYIPTFLIEYGDLTDTRKNFFEEKYFIFHAEFTCSPRML